MLMDSGVVDSELKVPLPVIVVLLRVAGFLCPIGGLAIAGAANMGDAAGWITVITSCVGTLLFWAFGSVLVFLNRIERHLRESKAMTTV